MKKLFIPLLLIVSLFSCEKKSDKSDGFVRIGKIDSIFSKDLNEERKFWIYLPYGVDKQPEPGKKYPVLYLLDGNAHFQSVTGLIQQLSSVNGNTLIPEMIVVAVPNTDRTRDLTPSHVSGDSTSGGAEKFTSFLQQLVTHIEQNYPVLPYRTLIGHSFGGLFAINTFAYHREMFNNYLAIDPSLWWDDQKLLKASKSLLDTTHFDKTFLYVAMAHTVKKGMSLKELATDTTEDSKHMRSIVEFCEFAASKSSNGLTFQTKYYPDDGHSSVVLISEHDALRCMFSWNEFSELNDYFESDSRQSPEEMIEAINAHYKKVGEHLGYNVVPDRQVVNDLGYYFMRENRSDRALALFSLNAKNYPKFVWVYDALGDYYLHQKDTVQALDNYEKALAISKENGIVEKVGKLRR